MELFSIRIQRTFQLVSTLILSYIIYFSYALLISAAGRTGQFDLHRLLPALPDGRKSGSVHASRHYQTDSL